MEVPGKPPGHQACLRFGSAHSRSRIPAAPRKGTRSRQLGQIRAAIINGSPQVPQGTRRSRLAIRSALRALRRVAPQIKISNKKKNKTKNSIAVNPFGCLEHPHSIEPKRVCRVERALLFNESQQLCLRSPRNHKSVVICQLVHRSLRS
jgi:hypothetical protein